MSSAGNYSSLELTRRIAARLPPQNHLVPRGEADYYGASSIVAAQLGLEPPPESPVTWRHGWDHQPLQRVEQLIQYGSRWQRHLVGRADQAEFLAEEGHWRSIAVGLPFIYADVEGVERVPSSLLVVPPHSLPYTQHEWMEPEYVDYVKGLLRRFDYVAAMVHPNCIQRGDWVGSFREAGIPVFAGASLDDRNALTRMQILLRSFESVTTNAIGSHVLYAGYVGARVSIAGPYAEYREADFSRDPYYQRFPDLLPFMITHSAEAYVRQAFPQFFVEPDAATPQVEWAKREIGAVHRHTPAEMKRLLGWRAPALWSASASRAARRLFRWFGGR